MRVSFIVLVMIVLMVGVVAFTSEQVFGDPEQRATERAILSQTVAYDQTQAPTIQALQQTVENIGILETQAAQAEVDLGNAVATQSVLTLTPAGFIPTALPTIETVDSFAADTESTFSDTAIASGINEATGCATNYRQTFQIVGANDPTQIYLTTLGHYLRGGTVIRTRWYAENDRGNAFESVTWSPTINHEQICIYFWLESSNIPYSSGTWMAELIVDGIVVDTVSFVMCSAEEGC